MREPADKIGGLSLFFEASGYKPPSHKISEPLGDKFLNIAIILKKIINFVKYNL